MKEKLMEIFLREFGFEAPEVAEEVIAEILSQAHTTEFYCSNALRFLDSKQFRYLADFFEARAEPKKKPRRHLKPGESIYQAGRLHFEKERGI